MATQTITYRRKKQKTQTAPAPKKRRSTVTRNNSTPSKVCPTCGGTGRVR